MGVLSIAFDITIVGALALPWVALVVYLFFPEGMKKLKELRQQVNGKNQAVTGVILFAVTYTLGSTVTRMAHDFSADDDLSVKIGRHILRVGPSERRIVTSVFCTLDSSDLLRAAADNPALLEKIYTFESQKKGKDYLCTESLKWNPNIGVDEHEEYLNGTAADIFTLQESAMMLKGEDATLRLRQLHDQIMVMRGAALNGLLTLTFCLYAWGQKLRREHSASPWRWLLFSVPVVYALVGCIALWNHWRDHFGPDPPDMEFCLLSLAVAGIFLWWWPRKSETQNAAETKNAGKAHEGASGTHSQNGPCRGWAAYSILSAILSVATILGWWSAEVVYAQGVVYSYDAKDAIFPPK